MGCADRKHVLYSEYTESCGAAKYYASHATTEGGCLALEGLGIDGQAKRNALRGCVALYEIEDIEAFLWAAHVDVGLQESGPRPSDVHDIYRKGEIEPYRVKFPKSKIRLVGVNERGKVIFEKEVWISCLVIRSTNSAK